jgi:adenylate kinase
MIADFFFNGYTIGLLTRIEECVMRLILLGAPGAGKGTQAELLAKDFGIPKISTGDMLRAAVSTDSPIGREVKQVIAEGLLVPDALINELVRARISEADCVNGYLFDGYPRTLAQANSLDVAGIVIDAVIEIAVTDEEIMERLVGRRIHQSSGRVYHTIYNPPRVANQDDDTGEPLIQREDDKLETVRKRLEIYHEQTEPLIAWYRQSSALKKIPYIRVQGHGSVEDIYNQITQQLLKISENLEHKMT